MTDKPLAGKTALITGSARNIGRAIALHLAERGANIVVNAATDQDAADAVAEEVRTLGVKSVACIADITDGAAVADMFARAGADIGDVDILVLNASARGQVPFLEMTHEQYKRVIDISFDGAFYRAQACIPSMQKKKWGRIVSLGGIAWHVGTANRVHSLMSKAGLAAFTRGLATEFAGDGINVNCVSPGFIETVRPASAGALPSTNVSAPISRLGTVDEIASMVTYLCLPESGYITGQVMHVNGGMYMAGC